MSEWQLILETSGRVGKVGLARGREVVHAAKLDENRRHARDLSETIRDFLARESLRVRDLKAILVSVGPGGYTGLRVGLATAKALAYAADVTMIAVPTFHALAEQAPLQVEDLWVIADALQGTVYVQQFGLKDGKRLPTSELVIERLEDWLPKSDASTWLSGPGVEVYREKLVDRDRIISSQHRDAGIDGVLHAAERLKPLGREELFRIEPLYLRGSSAEEKAKSAVS